MAFCSGNLEVPVQIIIWISKVQNNVKELKNKQLIISGF